MIYIYVVPVYRVYPRYMNTVTRIPVTSDIPYIDLSCMLTLGSTMTKTGLYSSYMLYLVNTVCTLNKGTVSMARDIDVHQCTSCAQCIHLNTPNTGV